MEPRLPLRPQARIGHLVGEWRLGRVLATGPTGVVYVSRHRAGGRGAVKIVREDFADDATHARFAADAIEIDAIAHPALVPILDEGRVTLEGGRSTSYVVTELLSGEPLSGLAKRMGGALPEAVTLRVADAILDVLVRLHGVSVVHRGIDAENVFLLDGLEVPDAVRVLDAGVGRFGAGSRDAEEGWSPEQWARDDRGIDARTDLFALGALMVRMLSGRSPAEIAGPAWPRHGLPPVRSFAPEVSPYVAAIVDRALIVARDERHASAAAMQYHVRRAAEGSSIWPQRSSAPPLLAQPTRAA
jgi:serine/threonine protein kinase